jgi:hypothetical protein
MTEASIGKDVTRARVMLTNLVGVVTLRPKKDGLESRAARKCAHPTGEPPILLQLVPGARPGLCQTFGKGTWWPSPPDRPPHPYRRECRFGTRMQHNGRSRWCVSHAGGVERRLYAHHVNDRSFAHAQA